MPFIRLSSPILGCRLRDAARGSLTISF